MKISLNKANKIRNLLETFVREKSNELNDNHHLSLTGYEQTVTAVKDRIAINEQKSINVFNLVFKGIQFEYDLREIIQSANHTKKINSVIAEIAKLNAELRGLAPHFPDEIEQSSLDISQILVTNRRSLEENKLGSYRSLPFAMVMSVDVEWYNEKVKYVADLKKRIRALEETRNELNHKSYVEIPDEIESYLTEVNLI